MVLKWVAMAVFEAAATLDTFTPEKLAKAELVMEEKLGTERPGQGPLVIGFSSDLFKSNCLAIATYTGIWHNLATCSGYEIILRSL